MGFQALWVRDKWQEERFRVPGVHKDSRGGRLVWTELGEKSGGTTEHMGRYQVRPRVPCEDGACPPGELKRE